MSVRHSGPTTTHTGARSHAQHPVSPLDRGVSVSEHAIEQYGEDLAYWAFFALKCGNRAIYPWSEPSRSKFGISKPTFYRYIGRMKKAGLCREIHTKSGVQWRLLERDTLRTIGGEPVKHRCHLILPLGATLQQVKDMLTMKLVERAHRQVAYAVGPKHENIKRRIRRERAEALCPLQERHRSALKANSFLTVLREDKETTLKRVHDGYCPMNTEKLMRETGKGREAVLSWKKRARGYGWIDWVRRDTPISADLYEHALGVGKEFCEYYGMGRFSARASGYWFHQASCYKLNITYGQPQSPEPKY